MTLKDPGNVSGTSAERYEWLMEKSLPAVSNDTLNAVLQAFNGKTHHTLAEIEALDFAASVMEDMGAEECNAETAAAIERDAGIEIWRLARLSAAEKLALVELIERYWHEDERARALDW